MAGAGGEIAETPGEDDPTFARVANRIIGSNGTSLDAAAGKAAELGFRVEIVSRALTGEAREAGAELAGRIGPLRLGLSERRDRRARRPDRGGRRAGGFRDGAALRPRRSRRSR